MQTCKNKKKWTRYLLWMEEKENRVTEEVSEAERKAAKGFETDNSSIRLLHFCPLYFLETRFFFCSGHEPGCCRPSNKCKK